MARQYKKCVDCGNTFISTRSNQIRCPACQKARDKEKRRTYRKPAQVTAKEVNPNECGKKKACRYGAWAGGMQVCDYIGMTGRRRNCPAKNCTKFERK